jgi:hypothetical protein
MNTEHERKTGGLKGLKLAGVVHRREELIYITHRLEMAEAAFRATGKFPRAVRIWVEPQNACFAGSIILAICHDWHPEPLASMGDI